MIAVPFSAVETAIKNCSVEIKGYKIQIQNVLEKLTKDGRIKGDKKRYIEYLFKISNNIITAKPSTISRYKKEFDKIIDSKMMKSSSFKSFKNKILNILAYSVRRSDFYPKYFNYVGIKACVYCNSMLAVSVEVENVSKIKKLTKAKFQVDHYLPKSEYPCFSISLYNLYPACANCNNSKSAKNVEFLLYSDGSKINSSAFKFDLDKKSVASFLLHRDSSIIKYKFIEPSIPKGMCGFDDTFAIQGIYDTQKDLAEELIIKAEIYTNAYRKTLASKYPFLLPKPDILNRILIGNYTLEKEMHKRPMAKFTIDIAKQVGLI